VDGPRCSSLFDLFTGQNVAVVALEFFEFIVVGHVLNETSTVRHRTRNTDNTLFIFRHTVIHLQFNQSFKHTRRGCKRPHNEFADVSYLRVVVSFHFAHTLSASTATVPAM